MLEVILEKRHGDKKQLLVLGAHLGSANTKNDEMMRLDDQVEIADGLIDVMRIKRGDAALVVVMDSNSHPQLDAEGNGRSVWRTMKKEVASVWDGYLDGSGQSLVRNPPVTTNKVRGPSTEQMKKIGVHAFHTIDHVFFDREHFAFKDFATQPSQFVSEAAALCDVLPSLTTPSDHYPVIVDLSWLNHSYEHEHRQRSAVMKDHSGYDRY